MVFVGTDERHYSQAGWTREQEVTNALKNLYGREAKTMSNASTSKTSSIHEGGVKTTGKRQSKRKDLLDALRTFKKEQEQQQQQHQQQQKTLPKSASSGSSSATTGIGSKSGSVASSSSITNGSDSHRAIAALHDKRQMERKFSQQFVQQLASESVEKENMVRNSNAFFDTSKPRRSTVSGPKTRHRPTTSSTPVNQSSSQNHSRTKSLLMQSTNFLRGTSATSIPSKPGSVEQPSTIPIASDYSEARSIQHQHSGIPLPHRRETLPTEENERHPKEFQMHSALTYPTTKVRPAIVEDQGSKQDQNRQPSLYKPLSARQRSKTLADVNAGSKSPSFEEEKVIGQNLSNDSFQQTEVTHELLPLPFGWTAEQDDGDLSEDYPISTSHQQDDGDDEVERLTSDLLLPSNMACRQMQSSIRRTSVARRYASMFKSNRSEESLVSLGKNDFASDDDVNNNTNQSRQSRLHNQTNTRNQFNQEPITPLPPRRQVRRARVQSTFDSRNKSSDVMIARQSGEEKFNGVNVSTIAARPSLADRRPTYHSTTIMDSHRIQRRISESSLSSAKQFFPLHDSSTDSRQIHNGLRKLNMVRKDALGVYPLANKSDISLYRSMSTSQDDDLKSYHQRQDSIPSTLPSLSSDQHLLSSGDEDEPSRVSFSSTNSFLSSTTGTHASYSTDGNDNQEGPIGPIIFQPTRRSTQAQFLHIPEANTFEKHATELSPTSFASANSEVWGSCNSNSNSSDAITTKMIGNQSASHQTSRKQSTGSESEHGAKMPILPLAPERQYRGRLGSTSKLQARPTLRRFGSEMQVHTFDYDNASQTTSSYDDMSLHSSLMRRSYNSPLMDHTNGSGEDDDGEGSICLETPTFGYVASFVTANNTTPRAPNDSIFQTPSWTSPRYSPSLTQPSLNGALDSRFTRPQFNLPSARGRTSRYNLYGTLDPRLGIYRDPVSPKTKSTSDDEAEEEQEKRQAISDWRNSAEAMRKDSSVERWKNKAMKNGQVAQIAPSLGLGLSHVRMALADQPHTLQKVKDIQTEQELLKARPHAHRSSVSQGPFAAMQNRRNSLRLNSTKSRN